MPQEKRSAGVYLLNLLVANLLFLGALPFKVLKDLGAAPWSLMVFHCQCSAVVTYISLYASVAFLTFIIVDRHLQVLKETPPPESTEAPRRSRWCKLWFSCRTGTRPTL